MIATATGSAGITVNGVTPEAEHRLTGLKDKITAGTYFTGTSVHEMIVSERLAKKLKLNLRKKAVLTVETRDGDMASAAFRVCATYRTVNAPYDDTHVFVPANALDSLAGIPGDRNEIAVLLHENQLLESVENACKQQFPRLETKSWMALSPELELTVTAGDQMVYIFMGIILLALAFGIVNTMMMAVLERSREIGMLLALGMNKTRIFFMVVWETIFLIAAGCPAGVLLAFGTIAVTHRTGIDMSRYSEAYASFGYASVNYPSLTMGQFRSILMLVILTAVVSALFPARKALQLKPAEAVKR
jgi:ABC-type lipoprotein release transport system permease subunit